jgi:hypothetical protein
LQIAFNQQLMLIMTSQATLLPEVQRCFSIPITPTYIRLSSLVNKQTYKT